MLHLSDKTLKDLTIITGALVAAFLLFSKFDVLELLAEFSQAHEEYEVDELLSTLIVFALCMLIFSWRRLRESDSARQIAEQKGIELQQAMAEIKTLQGVIPSCCYCHKIRDDKGAWSDLQAYINTHLNAEFSHGACPDCVALRLKELAENGLDGWPLINSSLV